MAVLPTCDTVTVGLWLLKDLSDYGLGWDDLLLSRSTISLNIIASMVILFHVILVIKFFLSEYTVSIYYTVAVAE